MHRDSAARRKSGSDLVLKVAGKEIEMVPFVHDALRDMILAFLKNLKGIDPGTIEIIIK